MRLWFQLPLSPDGDPAGHGSDSGAGSKDLSGTPIKTPLSPGEAMLKEVKERYARGEINFKGGAKALEREQPASSATAVKEPETDAEKEAAGQVRDPATGKFLPKNAPSDDGADPAGASGAPAGTDEGVTGGELEDSPESLTVMVPGRRPEDPEIPLAVEDKDTADAIRRLKNGYSRTEHLAKRVADVEERETELRYFEDYASADPVGLILDYMPKARFVDVVKHLLTVPEVFNETMSFIESWENPESRRAAVAELDRDRIKNKGEVQKELNRREVNRRHALAINTNIDRVAEVVTDEEMVEQFRDDANRAIANYIRTNKPTRLTAEVYLEALKPRLRLYGISPAQALAALSGQSPPSSPSHAARPSGPAAEKLAASGVRGVPGLRHVEASRVRKAAAAGTPGPGTGTGASRPVAPKGQGVLERIKWLKEQNPQFRTR
jgi:hypothetical protein